MARGRGGLHKAEAVAQQGGGCTGLRASEQVAAGLFAVTFGPTPQLLNQGEGGGKEEGRGDGERRGKSGEGKGCFITYLVFQALKPSSTYCFWLT